MAPDSASEPELADVAPATTAVIRATVPMDGIAAFFDRSFGRLVPVITGQGLGITGAAFALYHGVPRDDVDLEVGFTTDRPVQPDGDVQVGTRPGGRVARLVHRGSYDGLRDSWARLASWIAAQGLQPGAELWEVYVTAPTPDTDPAELRTELFWPVAG